MQQPRTRNADHALTWTYFPRVNARLGTSFAQCWGHLLSILSEHEERRSKGGPLWSPARYEAGARRSSENARDISCLVLDIDGHPCDDAALDPWMGLEYLAHSTYSHSENAPHWRVVFPLARPVPAEAWPDAYARFVGQLAQGGLADLKCSDAARMYYLPSHPTGGECFCRTNEGILLDPLEYAHLPLPRSGPCEPSRDAVRVPIARSSAGAYGAAALQSECDALARAVEGTRNDQLNRSAFALGQLVAAGSLGEAEVREGLTQAALACGLGEHEVTRTLHSGFTKGYEEPRQIPEGRQVRIHRQTGDRRHKQDCDAATILALAKAENVTGATDLDNAARFVALAKGALMCACIPGSTGSWLEWVGTHWRRDETAGLRLATRIGPALLRAAATETNEGLRRELATAGNKVLSHQRMASAVTLARVDLALRVEEADLDPDPWLLACNALTVDLRTGDARPADPNDLITRNTHIDYQPNASCPRWVAVLDRILPDPDVRAFVHRAAGYSVTGRTSERVMFVLYGEGRNGKSTFVRTIQDVMGDYAAQARSDIFLTKDSLSDDRGAVELVGRRMVATTETDQDRRLREAFIKAVTGQDPLTARRLYGEPFEYLPECKLWLASNHQPRIRGRDEAIWDRVRLIPFTERLADHEVDKDLPDHLREELEGILAWAIQGAVIWSRDGLRAPSQVLKATQDYRQGEDIFSSWRLECVDEVPEHECLFASLYSSYKTYCENAGEAPMRNRSFGSALSQLGYTPERGNGNVSVRRGLALKSYS